jgi:hypothetical protein
MTRKEEIRRNRDEVDRIRAQEHKKRLRIAQLRERWIEPTFIDKYKNGHEFTLKELLRALGIAKKTSQFFELDSAQLPFELLELVAEKLGGSRQWRLIQGKLNAEKRKAAAIEKHAKWQAEANKIWAKNLRLSRNAVAGLVKTNLRLGEKVDTIRKAIKEAGLESWHCLCRSCQRTVLGSPR